MKKKLFLITLVALFCLCSCGQQENTDIPTNPSTPVEPIVPETPTEPEKPVTPETPVEPEKPVKLKDFEGLILNDKEVTYSGEMYCLEVENLPEGANVTYKGGPQYEIGTYPITALVSKEGYNDKELTAKLTIIPADIKGLVFEGRSFKYDGHYHEVLISGVLPKGVKTEYKCLENPFLTNEFLDVGTYTVEAHVTCPNYNPITLTTKVVVSKNQMKDVDFEKIIYTYNGNYQSLAMKNVPQGSKIEYTCLSNPAITNQVRDVGKYKIRAKVTNKNYDDFEIESTIYVYWGDINDFFELDCEQEQYVYEGKTIKPNVKVVKQLKSNEFPSDCTIRYYYGYSEIDGLNAPGRYYIRFEVRHSDYMGFITFERLIKVVKRK